MTDIASPPAQSSSRDERDYASSLYLPRTDFPMRAGLPHKEPEILAHWSAIDLYHRLREAGQGRPKFILHDGPPYANGPIHIGHALNKILKDIVSRSQQMLGKDSNYVPGWDCHGLPIEWKIEEENYRSKGKNKPDLADAEAMIAFRRECRAYADHWVNHQREEFKRLGVIGDWDHPYLTMAYAAEAQIASEIQKFAANGLLYRGSKPVMWSVVEKTALAEAEIEYEDATSDWIFVGFPIQNSDGDLHNAKILIWTTTPWTIPGNRAIAYSPKISYGLFEVKEAPEGNWAKAGDRFLVADKLAGEVFKAAKVLSFERLREISEDLSTLVCAHPLKSMGYDFKVPLLQGDHVTDDAGAGFVHTAPGHGREDFDVWTSARQSLRENGIDPQIPYIVDADGFYTTQAPGFSGKRVLTEKGEKGDANEAVIQALAQAGALIARGRLKHQYPHSWRSKKPVIFRNTPQWFIAMDQSFKVAGNTERSLRTLALSEIGVTMWVPPAGQNRITGMIEAKPDWVVSRQRAWGVPIAVFVKRGANEILIDERVNARILAAFEKEGADAWFAQGASARFLQPEFDPKDFDKIDDVLDVWFDSGSTHAFVLEDEKNFPGLAGVKRKRDGGRDEILYLEGSDQHRGWFHSSLLESCGARGRAPYDTVLTHGFTLDERGRKMAKSLGNVVPPQEVIEKSGADILRLWTASVDYADDQRIGPKILNGVVDNYRKLRNAIRWMLGALAHYRPDDQLTAHQDLCALDQWILHRLAELDPQIRAAYESFDYKKVVALLTPFMISDLSAFYFDIRKDALYCEAPSSAKRKSALKAIDILFRTILQWLAPILAFTCEEAWGAYPGADSLSVHLTTFDCELQKYRNDALGERWRKIRKIRSVVTGALEIARAEKIIGSSLEAAPILYLTDPADKLLIESEDFAEICIVSDLRIVSDEGPSQAFRLSDAQGAAVVVRRADDDKSLRKCARSWRYMADIGVDPLYPDVCARDAGALREKKALGLWA